MKIYTVRIDGGTWYIGKYSVSLYFFRGGGGGWIVGVVFFPCGSKWDSDIKREGEERVCFHDSLL